MGSVQPFNFLGSFITKVVTLLTVELSTRLGSVFPFRNLDVLNGLLCFTKIRGRVNNLGACISKNMGEKIYLYHISFRSLSLLANVGSELAKL